MKKKILIIFFGIFLLFLFFPLYIKDKKFSFYEEGGGKLEEKKESLFLSQAPIFFPIRDWRVPPLNLKEKAGGAFLFLDNGKIEILYQKNIFEKLPFASLTKLMTAMVVLDRYDLLLETKISREAVTTPEEAGGLFIDERISVEGLLELLLLSSSNDSATSLAEIIGKENFIKLMNEKAKKIGMENTEFLNPHGLDQKGHFSSVFDLALMTSYSLKNYPKIWEILKIKQKIVVGFDHLGRKIFHFAKNTNELLDLPLVLGGKTGYTKEAQDSMILAIKAPGKVNGKIILVLLGTDDRTLNTYKLYNWVLKAYLWE